MTNKPRLAEAKSANHRALRSPRQGVRDSLTSRLRNSGSSFEPGPDESLKVFYYRNWNVKLQKRRCSSGVEQLIRNQ